MFNSYKSVKGISVLCSRTLGLLDSQFGAFRSLVACSCLPTKLQIRSLRRSSENNITIRRFYHSNFGMSAPMNGEALVLGKMADNEFATMNDDRLVVTKRSNDKNFLTPTTIAEDEKTFNDLFPVLIEDLTAAGLADSETSDAFRWFKRVSEYNVPYGKRNRGLAVVQSYRYLTGDTVTKQGLFFSSVMGWCIEWVQAFFVVADDIMDNSQTRRGQPCWYKLDEIGLKAINDTFYLESAIYVILRKYLRSQPCYVDIVDLFHEITLQTIVGQNLDLLTAPPNGVDFTGYTMERYTAIVKHKTAYYSFYLPVACAMHLAGVKDEQSFLNARSILLKMGEYFQIQDDYLDCFGDPEVTGKIGTDIEDNKCSWLVIQALKLANREQRLLLESNYGCHDADKVSKVKSLYDTLKLCDVYATYEDKSYGELMEQIDRLGGDLPKDMFRTFAQKCYKRQK